MDVTLPDGTVIEGVPDGTTKQQLLGKLMKIGHPAAGDLAQRMGGEQTVKEMGTGERLLVGAGKAGQDLIRGTKQLLGRGDQAEIDASREVDRPLMKTGAGFAGNLAGNVAAFLPTAAIPGANTLTGAALVGAGMGAMSPTATGESHAANAGLGAILGVGGQAAGQALGRAVRPIASRLSHEQELLAQSAAREGIPLTAGQRTGSRPLQIAESVMENLPLTSGPQLAGREAQQRAFTAAALRRAGIAGDAATPEALAAQRAALGTTMQDIANANTLNFNRGLADRLAEISGEASMRGPTAAAPVNSLIDRILGEVGQSGDMAGKTYQAWRQRLRPLASAGGENAHLYGQIRRALDDAFNSQMEAAGSEAWKGANRQYANLKTIMQAAGGPGAPAASNQLAPSQLAAALRGSIGKEGVALGRGDLNNLTRIGTTFVKDQIPNSGTAQRQLIQALLTSGIGTGAGTGTALALGKDPLEGAAYGAGIGAGALIAPRLAQGAMNSQLGQRYLASGAVPLTDAHRRALAAAMRSLSVGSTPMLAHQ